MKKKALFIIATYAIFTVGVIAYVTIKNKTNQATQPIRIGAILPLTGPASSVGNIHRESIEWAIEKQREAGIDIELVLQDSKTDPKQAVQAFQYLINTQNISIIISTLSSDTLAIKPLAEEKRVLLITDATHPDILDNSSFTLRHSFIIDRDSQTIANHIHKHGYKTIGLLHQQDDVGTAYQREFETLAEKNLWRMSSEQINQREGDFRTPLQKIIANKPDVLVFVALGPAAGRLIQQSRELGYQGHLYSWPGFIVTPDAAIVAGKSANGMWYSTFQNNQRFYEDYMSRFGKPPAAIGSWKFTDIELLSNAIIKTKSQDPGILVGFIKGMKQFQGTYEHVEITPEGNMIVPTHIETWHNGQ